MSEMIDYKKIADLAFRIAGINLYVYRIDSLLGSYAHFIYQSISDAGI